MLIPKKIHYIWVGGQEKPAVIQRCMKSWSKHLGAYEIKEWNESNFDIEAHPFAQQAYQMKKWAFVSDYIRAWALYHEGGIYLDTDVLVLDDLSRFREHEAFVGFEQPTLPFTAVFGCVARHPLAEAMLALFEDNDFYFDPEDPYKLVNTLTVSDLMIRKFHCLPNNQFQMADEGIAVYPDDVLCNPSAHSSAIHVFTGTWLDGASPLKKKFVRQIKLRLINKKRAALYNKLFRSQPELP